MAMQVILAASAAPRGLKKLERGVAGRMVAAIKALATEPLPPGAKKLAGHPLHRVRVGDYRIVYQVRPEKETLVVLKVGHRREVYERLDELRTEP